MNYYETQTMKRQGTLSVAILFIGLVIAFNYYEGRNFLTIIPYASLTVIVLGMIYLCRLDTEVNSVAIRYRFKPFHVRSHTIEWKDIEEARLRKYHPLWEYKGWGISWGKAGMAYSTQGNVGLQLVLKNGKRILFGTQKPNELKNYLTKLRETYAIPLVDLTESTS
ncbi:hypothetical protein H8S90_13145 [Olivibacter sp. SDN3]|uniref:hypothetical protein n=1 Tax=Olivibacter sp. SDN3 TaxID=2764720 RepID=UPI001651413C|nr:hypothetical protein [Olivibacter sp. SDN3]QNL47769.1 hypothetical protein H8S90_13145 [Olivibacter sp. SDN3]